MKDKKIDINPLIPSVETMMEIDFDGYPLYPVLDEKYGKFQKEKNVNLDEIPSTEIVKK